jgi:SRSO17 transposase
MKTTRLAKLAGRYSSRVGESSHPSFFLANAGWSVEELRTIRFYLTLQALRERPFILCIDETGDRKKGKTTDYAGSQCIGTLHGLANGVVSVNVHGVLETVSFPLAFRLYGPKTRLKAGDRYKSKPQGVVSPT